MRAYCFFHPHRSLEIVSYFNHAARFLNVYRFSDFVIYDRQLRLRLANNQALRWDSIDIELQSMFLKSPGLKCIKCKSFDHSTSHCPTMGNMRGSHSQRTANPYTIPDTPSSSRFRNAPQPPHFGTSNNPLTPTGQRFQFNNNGFCDKSLASNHSQNQAIEFTPFPNAISSPINIHRLVKMLITHPNQQ